MRLINNWRRCWRMFSVQCMAAAIAIEGAWAFLPPEMKDSIPEEWVSAISVVVLALGFFGRLVVQPKVSGET